MPSPLLTAFRFEVSLRRAEAVVAGSNLTLPSAAPSGDALGDGAFQEVNGLEIEMDIQQLQEGGRNDGVIQRIGRAKYSNLVLKRGMFFGTDSGVNRDLWLWIQGLVSGTSVARYDGLVLVKSQNDGVVATWQFTRGLPAKVRGPELNAKTGEIAIEELTIAHEGLRMVEG